MKKFLVLIALLGLYMTTMGAVVTKLPGIESPKYLAVDDQQFYVSDREVISIYSLKDNKLVGKFGKRGEGPQEFLPLQFTEIVAVFPQKDSLFILSQNKISFYTRTGKYIKEKKLTTFQFALQPLGQNYAGYGFQMDQKTQKVTMALTIYDPEFKKIKELINRVYEMGKIPDTPDDSFNFAIWKNKMAVPLSGSPEEVNIGIFDATGKKLAEIKHKYPPMKITEKYKQKVFETIEKNPQFKQFKEIVKQRTKFKAMFPAIQSLIAADDKIYVLTYQEKNGQMEFLIFDFNGKFIKQIFVPVSFAYGLLPDPMAIRNNKLYQLIDNEDEDVWELHATELK